MFFDYLIIYFAIVVTAVAQIFLKVGADNLSKKYFIIEVNSYILFGYILMVIAVILNIRGLRNVPLRDMAFILPTIYILVPMFSVIFLKEKISKRQIKGTVIIILGAFIFNVPIVQL